MRFLQSTCMLGLFFLAYCQLTSTEALFRPARQSTTDPLKDRRGAVASESSICSNFGIDALRDGGNAADAVRLHVLKLGLQTDIGQLVATVFCIGVIGMYHSGLGGGGFLLVRASNGEYEFVGACVLTVEESERGKLICYADFRETAAASYSRDMYNNSVSRSLYGGLARYVILMLSLTKLSICWIIYPVSNPFLTLHTVAFRVSFEA